MIYWNGCSFVQGAENEFHQQFPALFGSGGPPLLELGQQNSQCRCMLGILLEYYPHFVEDMRPQCGWIVAAAKPAGRPAVASRAIVVACVEINQ